MLQKIYFMFFERYIPELKKYDGISFLHQPMTSGQPLKIVQRHMAHPVVCHYYINYKILFLVVPLVNTPVQLRSLRSNSDNLIRSGGNVI